MKARTVDVKNFVRQALRLFDLTGHVHGLTKSARPLVEDAAHLGIDTIEVVSGQGGTKPSPRKRERETVHLARRLAEERARLPSANWTVVPTDDEEICIASRIAAILLVARGLRKSLGPRARIRGVADADGKLIIDAIDPDQPSAVRTLPPEGVGLWNSVLKTRIAGFRVRRRKAKRTPSPTAKESLSETAERIVRRQMDQLDARTYGLGYGGDIEYVHEMRVALRRVQAALRVFAKSPDETTRDFRKEVGWFARSLGTVRDTDVFLGFLCEFRADVDSSLRPPLTRLIRAEQDRRRRWCKDLIPHFFSDRYRRMLASAALPADQAPQADPAPVHTIREAPRRLNKGLRRVLAHEGSLDKLSSEDQHALRIACKRLRYSAEFFSTLYKNGLRDIIDPMVQMQDALGEVHDADVYAERVRKYFAAARGPGTSDTRACNALLAHLRARREQSLRAAAKTWRGLTRKKSAKRLLKTVRTTKRR